MELKFLEIRDEGTCIPALAIQMTPDGRVSEAFLWRCGYPREGVPSVVLMRLSDQKATSDPYEWAGLTGDRRTMPYAHAYIIDAFPRLRNGQVVDVRVILREASEPAEPEIARGAFLKTTEFISEVWEDEADGE